MKLPGAGTDVAIQTADIILVRSNPIDAVAILDLSRATFRKILQNLAWATEYNAFAIPIAVGNPYTYSALMFVSTVIIAINARFLWIAK